MATNHSTLKSVAIGALAGAVVFLALSAVRAQTALSVADVRGNPKQYVGSEVQVTGLATSIRSDTKWVNGQKVPCLKLNLYETDAKGKKGSHYIYVSLPTTAFRFVPNDGDSVAIQGTLKWPYEIAVIDQ